MLLRISISFSFPELVDKLKFEVESFNCGESVVGEVTIFSVTVFDVGVFDGTFEGAVGDFVEEAVCVVSTDFVVSSDEGTLTVEEESGESVDGVSVFDSVLVRGFSVEDDVDVIVVDCGIDTFPDVELEVNVSLVDEITSLGELTLDKIFSDVCTDAGFSVEETFELATVLFSVVCVKAVV